MNRAGRAITSAALGAVAGAIFLALAYGLRPDLRIQFDHDPPHELVRGIHPAERDTASGLTFAWSQADLALRLPGLDRSVEWELELRLRAGRANAEEIPELTFYADGVLLMSRAAPADFDAVRVAIPARPDQRRGAVIWMQSSATFIPGPDDPRPLGVQVDWIQLRPIGIVLPPRRAFAGASGAGAILGAAVALLSVTAGSAVGAALLLSAGAAAQISRGFGPHTDYPTTMLLPALWIGCALVAGAWIAQRIQGVALRNTARFALAFTAGALFFKLLVLLHPNMPAGDAVFHVDGFHRVLAGTLYFTSQAPGEYRVPDAPGLYVFSAPLAGFLTRGAADMTLLRIVTTSVDAAAALVLYLVIVRRWNDRRAGAIAVALYHLIPLQFQVFTVGSLTNAFAQSVAVLALGLMASSRIRLERPLMAALLTMVLAAAFMSHASTFPLLFTAAVLAGMLFVARGSLDLRRSGFIILAAAAVALGLAVALYYAHFGETYRAEFARISAETATAAPDAGGRGIGARLGTVPYYLSTYFGLPALLLAGFGAVYLWRAGARDRLTLVAAGWALSCLAFMAIGILTPVDMRYYLAAVPALALVGGLGASRLWDAYGHSRGISAILLAWAVRVGTLAWWRTF